MRLVTSPIFYVNAAPHVGHLYSVVLCDVLHRYRLMKKESSFFSTGTDEHGLKIQQAAKSDNALDFCTKVSDKFKRLFDSSNIKYSRFIRTTDQDHIRAVQHLWNELEKRNLLYKDVHSGWYSVSDETFVTSTIQKCVDGSIQHYSKDTGKPLEWLHEVNYKFKLTLFKDQLIEWIQSDAVPADYRKILLNHLENLQDLSVSRPKTRVRWAIDVQNDPEHKIYVWLDALTNYLTVCGYPDSLNWNPDIHVVGKDIIKFHGIYWPAFLLALGLKLPRKIVAHGHFISKGEKMSKSIGNIIDPTALLNEFGADPVRYYLMRDGCLTNDTEFSVQQLHERTVNELSNQLGNLLLRVTSKKVNPDQSIPISIGCTTLYDKEFSNWLHEFPLKLENLYENCQINQVMDHLHKGMLQTNAYIQSRKPWKMSDPMERRTVLFNAFQSLKMIGLGLLPVIPSKAEELLQIFQIQHDWSELTSTSHVKDIKFNQIKPLFPK